MIVFQQINIWDNPIQYISPCFLRDVQLEVIYISSRLLKQAPSITPIGASVKKVEFDNNEILYVPDDYFYSCVKLEMVQFSYNMVQRLPNLSPIALTLQKLYFSHNLLNDVTSLNMATFLKLHTIELQSNQITHFFFHSDTLPNLRRLNLAFNRLTEIDELYFTVSAFSVPTSGILISHNSWNCSEEFIWVAQSMHTQGRMEPKLRDVSYSPEFVWSPSNTSKTAMCDLHRTLCSSPPALVNCSIMDIGKINETYSRMNKKQTLVKSAGIYNYVCKIYTV